MNGPPVPELVPIQSPPSSNQMSPIKSPPSENSNQMSLSLRPGKGVHQKKSNAYAPTAQRVGRRMSTCIPNKSDVNPHALKLHKFYSNILYYATGARGHPETGVKGMWVFQHKYSFILQLLIFPLTAGKALDNGKPTAPLMSALQTLMMLNCALKKVNMHKWAKEGGTIDAVVLNLSTQSAEKVHYIATTVFKYTLGASSGKAAYFPAQALPTMLIFALPIWAPPIFNSDNFSFPVKGAAVQTWFFLIALLMNYFSLNYSAFTTTCAIFGPMSYALSLSAKDFVSQLEENFEDLEWGNGEDKGDDEESLIHHQHHNHGAQQDPAEYSKRLRATIEKFNVLKSTTRHFSTGFGAFFLVAEFVLIPSLIVVGFIIYLKVTSDMDARDKCVLIMCSILFTLIFFIVLFLFFSGVHLTTQLEEVTHRISEVKGQEILLRTGHKWDDYLKQWERWERNVVVTDLGFTPFKIRIESKLALTVFYVAVGFAVTVYIEISL
ncbi:hypothetical protein TrCOL_g6947 [Triparma columacea]|uniref:Uncharacterized protein n=2 Tax=Triparma columacea TaxID=722753 RepID=A0A9W7LE93_9STRA|nr:hypothetical protein TrCOL_g6947 [Triparma columacea]